MGFLFESSAGVLHWHERCPKWPSRFSTSYQSSNTCIWKQAHLRDPASRSVKKAGTSGGGRKRKAPQICSALFSWFVNVREALKGRLPKPFFKLKAKELYAEWLIHNPSEPENQLRFENQWIIRNLQNVWTVRNFFIKKYDIDPPVINEDQMKLHNNENASQKTLAFKGLDTYVKENYMLSRERATVFTQTLSDSSIDLNPEFLVKLKGTRTKLNQRC